MKSVDELKEMIVDLRMQLMESNVPYGVCPYAYYGIKDGIDCDVVDCHECRIKFLNEYKQQLEKWVENL